MDRTDARAILTALVAAPAVLVACAVTIVELWRAELPNAPLFATPFVYSLAEAIDADDVARAHAFIRAGQNPNTPIQVVDAVLTAGRPVVAPPLVWAVARQRRDIVLMLLGFGAQVDSARNAACLADALHNADIANVLRRFGPAPTPEECQHSGLPQIPLK